jgi:hypothetical protein
VSDETKVDSEQPAPVLTFKPRGPKHPYPATAAQHDFSKPECRHLHAVVDERRRTLVCRECGVSLDPIAFITKLARKWDRRVFEQKEYERLNAALHEVMARKGRISIAPSGTTVRVPGLDGSEIQAGSSSGLGRIEQLLRAIESINWKAQKKGAPPA